MLVRRLDRTVKTDPCLAPAEKPEFSKQQKPVNEKVGYIIYKNGKKPSWPF